MPSAGRGVWGAGGQDFSRGSVKLHMFKTRRTLVAGGVFVSLTALVLGALFAVHGASAATATTTTFVSHNILVHPQTKFAGTPDAGPAVHFGCQDRPLDGSHGARCYQPAQIQQAYDIAPLLSAGITGQGRTIVIVDAFSNPYIQTDLQIFDQEFGLPDPALQIIAPFGQTPFDVNDGNQVGWSAEISLDVQWAHAVAPGAKIVLALAKTNADVDIYNTTKYVVDHDLGDVISQSFGEAESCVDRNLLRQEHAMFAEATAKGMTIFASSGDSGASQFNCDGTQAILSASSPASDPLVVGVGGTTLLADHNTGAYVSETAWTEPFLCNPPDDTGMNCSGGGFSNLYSLPDFQAGIPNTQPGHRGVPDVAYDAGVAGGVLVHWGVGLQAFFGLDPRTPAFFIFGGTSAGSPQWAGLTALGDQQANHRLGFITSALYRISQQPGLYSSAFHDITVGSNTVAVNNVGGYSTETNWDAVTGLGTPDANVLLPLISQYTRPSDGESESGQQ